MTFTFDKFFATFITLANTTFKRKSNIYKYNPFLFTVNYQ